MFAVLITGPPGAGKTSVLTALVDALSDDDMPHAEGHRARSSDASAFAPHACHGRRVPGWPVAARRGTCTPTECRRRDESAQDHAAPADNALRMLVSSPTAPAVHALWRVPGEHAKGIVYESGRVHAWPEAEASHGAVARDHVRQTSDHPIVCFLIRPDGTVTYASRYACHTAALRDALRYADPTLTVVAPPHSAGPAGPEDAAVAALCRWLEFGTPASTGGPTGRCESAH